MSGFNRLLELLRLTWNEIDGGSSPVLEPTLRSLDDHRTEFVWQGRPLLFNRRDTAISRDGRVLAKFGAVKSIRITESPRIIDEESCWTVELEIGLFRSILIGKTEDQVVASVAAAQVATATGKKVRVG